MRFCIFYVLLAPSWNKRNTKSAHSSEELWRSRQVLSAEAIPSSISIILQMIRKPNSIIATFYMPHSSNNCGTLTDFHVFVRQQKSLLGFHLKFHHDHNYQPIFSLSVLKHSGVSYNLDFTLTIKDLFAFLCISLVQRTQMFQKRN